ncbi:MAG: hypothetical protein PHU71_06805, partial [Candidatus Gracilibacteria bacterium]|nr:hypothetical protein [Candidatus Gracilibacteria bacterium]
MGCFRRSLDADRYARYFTANGFTLAGAPAQADYILFVTCAFMKRREDYVLQRIEELRRHKGKLIIGGCMKAINEVRLAQNFQGPSFAASDQGYLDTLFPDFKIKFKDTPDANFLFKYNIFQLIKHYLSTIRLDLSYLKSLKYAAMRLDRKYYYVRICWGCPGPFCTYCSIWRAVGKLRSKPHALCMEEFRKGLAKGYRHFVVSADNVGAYGLDTGSTFPSMLAGFIEVPGKYEIEIEELHP